MVRFVVIFVALVNSVFAIPQLINYQGQLTSPSGAPLDTTVAMTFKLYGVASGGTAVWTETYSPVIVSKGLFNVQLGSMTALPDLFDVNRWLGVTVGNNSEMSSRQQVVSVAHSYRVGTVDWASGGHISSPVSIQGELQVGDANTTTGVEGIVVGSDNILGAYRSSITGGSDHVIDATAHQAHVGGGISNAIYDSQYGVIGGGANNTVNKDYGAVGGGRLNSSGNACFVGGGVGNRCAGHENAIVGGDSNSIGGASISVISGGAGCIIDSIVAGTIAGGHFSRVAADYGTVGGGFGNITSGQGATISGGMNNSASGNHSFVAGGGNNEAAHNYCFAGGNNSHAIHSGAFVWGDGWGTNLTSSANDQFSVRASGGYRLFSNNSHTSGVTMSAGGSAWVAVSDSTKKRDIRLSDTKAVLDKIAELPIKAWQYKSEAEGVEHIGPMAQDFWNAFGLGSDSLGIETIDADGVLFAAIQELAKQNAAQEKEIEVLRDLVQQLIQLGQK